VYKKNEKKNLKSVEEHCEFAIADRMIVKLNLLPFMHPLVITGLILTFHNQSV
jgi:hypothetical protein